MNLRDHAPARRRAPRAAASVGGAAPYALLALLFAATAASQAARAAGALDAEACVEIALRDSPRIAEAEAKVAQYKARLAEVESIYYPKLQGMAYLAPMFTVEGSALQSDVVRKWKSAKDWGPYTALDAILAWPLYTFGRVEAGAEAAAQRAEVEQARVRETRNVVALEVRKLYYLRLFALSMQPTLRNTAGLLDEAIELAQERFDAATGEVTQVDLSKLQYGRAELKRHMQEAQDGVALVTSALKHTMGLPEDTALTIAESRLSEAESDNLPELGAVLARAARDRPEWQQLGHGKKATEAWRLAEAKANWPVLFAAAQFRAAWTPTRDDIKNPYHWDPYNEIFGGVAVGFKFDIDPASAAAKVAGAAATGDEIAALARFAATGIPLQVRKAHQELTRYRDLTAAANDGVTATRKWMTFAAAAHKTGTGEARDVLEGLVAHLQAKNTYYETLQKYYVARAELTHATGAATAADLGALP